MKKAIIQKVNRGKQKGMFLFHLIGAEGEHLVSSAVHATKEAIHTLIADYFPDAEVIDQTEASPNFILVD